MGKKWKQWQILFSWALKLLWMVTAAMKLKDTSTWKKSYDKPRQSFKRQRHHLADKCPYSQRCVFHVWMWEMDHKEGSVLKIWCFQTVILKKTFKSPLDSKEVKQSLLKEINLEYSLEGLMLKLKLQYFSHLMWRADSLEKTLLLGKRLSAAGEGDGKEWNGWMAPLIQWMWVWANSGK